MLDMGYLTISKKKGLDLKLRIPNKEVRVELENHLYSVSYYKKVLNITDEYVRLYVKHSRRKHEQLRKVC